MFKFQSFPALCCLVITVSGLAEKAVADTDNPLEGLIDFHVHSGPDSMQRSVTDLEIARIAHSRGMRALVLKNHFTMTADRAWLAEEETGMRCYGGIALNRAVGGLNAEAVRNMVAISGKRGKVVWLPTFDAENHVKKFNSARPFVTVVRNGKVVPELEEIFRIIAEQDLVMQTGHSSPEESLILIRSAKAAGVTKIVVTHAMAGRTPMNIEQMKEAAALGAKLECVWMTNLMGPNSHLESFHDWPMVSTDDYAEAMREVGPEHFILSSDFGQYLNPLPTDGMKAFVLELRDRGFSDKEIRLMGSENAAWLLGME